MGRRVSVREEETKTNRKEDVKKNEKERNGRKVKMKSQE